MGVNASKEIWIAYSLTVYVYVGITLLDAVVVALLLQLSSIVTSKVASSVADT